MSNPPIEKNPPTHRASALSRWIHHAFDSRGIQVQYRVRGNHLHVLCHGAEPPDRLALLLWLLPALQATPLDTLLPAEHPPLYQMQLYGCRTGQNHPEWTASVYLNQLDRHLEQLRQIQATALVRSGSQAVSYPARAADRVGESAALAISNRSLAKRGQEIALASYLGETLGDLGVAVRVSVKTIAYTPPASVRLGPSIDLTSKRLWVACEASYRPDPALIGEPITQKLRELEIEGYRDAIIQFQVVGETQPDWLLRVDLTPPGEMLREWARWGDVEAIQRLLNQAFMPLGMRLASASLKEATLHLFCSLLATQQAAAPNQAEAKAAVMALLDSIAPQGIHSTTLYGQTPTQETPAWIDWLELPASVHLPLADTALTLAQRGDWDAIAFLLHRLLNPDLGKYLATGGIRLQLLPKQDLLHVMSEAPQCPQQRQVGAAIVRFLQQLQVPELAGVRIYGRRAGQKYPLWSYGVDFTKRDRLVPEATPEFAATDAYVQDLTTQVGEPALRPDLTPADVQAAWTENWHQAVSRLQQVLIRSRLFVPDQHGDDRAMALPGQVQQRSVKEILVWGAAGILLTVQGNWLLSQWAHVQPVRTSAPLTLPAAASSTLPVEPAKPEPAQTEPSPRLSLKRSPDEKPGEFNTQGFTQSGSLAAKPSSEPAAMPYTPQNPSQMQTAAAIVAAAPDLPTFNSRQLDEKLKLYYRYLEDKGHPPDVLVVGSSRALRGIDPVALKTALAKVGYSDVEIFNFGINGATAQVVNLVVQRLLTPEQLPRLILWADGARAFNSGATDVTYNGVVASEAYRQLSDGRLALPQPIHFQTTAAPKPTPRPTAPQSINTTLTSSYEALDRWLSQWLASASGNYDDRDRLKHLIQQRFMGAADPASQSTDSPLTTRSTQSAQSSTLQADDSLTDTAGFLSLAIQFNPATYYQKYARVPGDYDSDYDHFQIPGKQEDALNALLQFTQAHQIPIVFANLPLTEDYLDPTRYEHEQEFKAYMVKRAMSQSGLIFRNMSDRWTTKYGYFSDPSHLNRYGAYAVSHELAQDPLIPWSKAHSTAGTASSNE